MDKGLKLLVLSCCAPCSCAVIKKLSDEGVNATVLFYNPNIFPHEEYVKRLEEQKRVCALFNIPFVDLPYENALWQECVKGLEKEPERGRRCSACFYMRLKRAAQYGKEHHFDAFASVLGVSRYKNLAQVDEQAHRASAEENFPYVDENWRKGGLEELRHALIKELKLYRQTYCGCPYSKKL